MSVLICNKCSTQIQKTDQLAVQDEGRIIHAECAIDFKAAISTNPPQSFCKKCDRTITAEEITTVDSDYNLIHQFCVTKLLTPQSN